MSDDVGHIFGVSKQVGLVYKCAILGGATSIKFCYHPVGQHMHTDWGGGGIFIRKVPENLTKPGIVHQNP